VLDIAGRLSKLETQMTTVLGNGRPGKLRQIEDDIETFKEWKWSLVGAAGAISVIVSIGAWILERTWK